jgi:hypothetical protein
MRPGNRHASARTSPPKGSDLTHAPSMEGGCPWQALPPVQVRAGETRPHVVAKSLPEQASREMHRTQLKGAKPF